jgi:hypothetical protein
MKKTLGIIEGELGYTALIQVINKDKKTVTLYETNDGKYLLIIKNPKAPMRKRVTKIKLGREGLASLSIAMHLFNGKITNSLKDTQHIKNVVVDPGIAEPEWTKTSNG